MFDGLTDRYVSSSTDIILGWFYTSLIFFAATGFHRWGAFFVGVTASSAENPPISSLTMKVMDLEGILNLLGGM